jgi:hypothetical protein
VRCRLNNNNVHGINDHCRSSLPTSHFSRDGIKQLNHINFARFGCLIAFLFTTSVNAPKGPCCLGPGCNHPNVKFKHLHGREPASKLSEPASKLRFDDVQSSAKIVATARHSQKTTTNESLILNGLCASSRAAELRFWFVACQTLLFKTGCSMMQRFCLQTLASSNVFIWLSNVGCLGPTRRHV